MKQKRILVILLTLTMILSVGCGSKKETEKVEETKEKVEEKTEAAEETETAKEEETEAEEKVAVDETKAEAEKETEKEKSEKILRLTTTTSVNDSGLMEYLREPLKEDTGIEMEIVSKGSGAAIEDGRQGNADIILVHSPKAENEFVDEGYGLERNTFMHNYFVIVGPEEDPAGIEGKTAEEAFQAIAETGSTFVSRGDDSGTHSKEKSIWEGAGIDLAEIETAEWYNSLGDGMGATLTFSSENAGYTLTDLSTFLSMESEMAIKVLVDQSDSLKNVYSVIIVNPDKVEGTNFELAKEFEDWITGERAAELIAEYGKEQYGQPLFFVGE